MAIKMREPIEAFLRQPSTERVTFPSAVEGLTRLARLRSGLTFRTTSNRQRRTRQRNRCRADHRCALRLRELRSEQFRLLTRCPATIPQESARALPAPPAQVLADEVGLLSERERLLANRDRQFEEIAQAQPAWTCHRDGAATRRYHSLQLLGDVRGIDEKRKLVAQQLQLCRQALTKADAEVKVLERLEEKQRAAFLYEAERRCAA